MDYVPDNLDQLPEEVEQEEKEFLVSAWVPALVEVRVYGTDEETAIQAAKEEMAKVDMKRYVNDWDLSEFDFDQMEEV